MAGHAAERLQFVSSTPDDDDDAKQTTFGALALFLVPILRQIFAYLHRNLHCTCHISSGTIIKVNVYVSRINAVLRIVASGAAYTRTAGSHGYKNEELRTNPELWLQVDKSGDY